MKMQGTDFNRFLSLIKIEFVNGSLKEVMLGEIVNIPVGEKICVSLTVDKLTRLDGGDYYKVFVLNKELMPVN